MKDIPIYFDNRPQEALIIEEWRYINLPGVVKNYYLISNFGIVKNIKGQIITPKEINSGYLIYILYTGEKDISKKYKRFLAHRLVLLVYNPIENPELFTVNHIDMNKHNNYVGNLEWLTQKENNEKKELHYFNHGTHNYHALFNLEQLKIIIQELNKNTKYSDILKILGIEDTKNNRDYIGNIKRGKTYQKEIKYYGLDRFID